MEALSSAGTAIKCTYYQHHQLHVILQPSFACIRVTVIRFRPTSPVTLSVGLRLVLYFPSPAHPYLSAAIATSTQTNHSFIPFKDELPGVDGIPIWHTAQSLILFDLPETGGILFVGL